MKQRIITGIIGILLLIVSLFFYRTIGFDILVCLVYLIAVYEVYGAFKEKNSIFLTIASAIIGVAVLMRSYIPFVNFDVLVFLFTLIFAVAIVKGFHDVDFKTAAAALAYNIYILAGLYSVTNMRLSMPYSSFGYDSAFMLLLCLALAWGGDICAYFTGYFFGKHKMTPVLSPKKTVEGAIGGVIGSVIFGFVSIFIYAYMKPLVEHTGSLIYAISFDHMLPLVLSLTAVFVISSLIAIVGDLFASAVKRQVGIKDYGTIIPGHGGILDRFDSVLLVTPFINMLSYFVIERGGVFFV